MKLSELIEEMIQMKIEGPHEWRSMQGISMQQERYYQYLEELKNNIDEIVKQHKD
jgi:hypothetical protein